MRLTHKGLTLGVFVLTVVVIFTSCATLSKQECLSGNWSALGERDGSNGEPSLRLQKHADACKEYGVTPDPKQYEAGRARGLQVFCTPSNGLEFGRRGGQYNNVCPANLEGPFVRRYEIGRKLNEKERRVSHIYNEISDKQNQLETEHDQWRRRRLRDDIADLNRERDNLQRELTVLEIEARESKN